MNDAEICLKAAMFAASESYSASTYETYFSASREDMCGDMFVYERALTDSAAIAA